MSGIYKINKELINYNRLGDHFIGCFCEYKADKKIYTVIDAVASGIFIVESPLGDILRLYVDEVELISIGSGWYSIGTNRHAYLTKKYIATKVPRKRGLHSSSIVFNDIEGVSLELLSLYHSVTPTVALTYMNSNDTVYVKYQEGVADIVNGKKLTVLLSKDIAINNNLFTKKVDLYYRSFKIAEYCFSENYFITNINDVANAFINTEIPMVYI